MTSKNHTRLLIALLTLLPATARAGDGTRGDDGQPSDRIAVEVRAPDDSAWQQVAEELERSGAELRHRFPPDLLVGTAPPGVLETFEAPAGVTLAWTRDGAERPLQARSWARLGEGVSRFLSGATQLPADAVTPGRFGGDALKAAGDPMVGAPSKSFGECGLPAATSAYLVGRVSVAIVLMESDGSGTDPDLEDWSNEDPAYVGMDRRDLVVAEIMEGLDFLAASHPTAGLSFTYDVQTDVLIPEEPIEHDAHARTGWIRSTMEALAFGGFSPSSNVRAYVNHLRELHDTDWGVVAFVMDSLLDADGAPPSGFPFAYALLGGPYLVMTYDNSSWGLDDMDTVMAHELAHCFNALDEYSSAGNTCSRESGYLRIPNANNDSPPDDTACLSNVSCIMRAERGSVCEFTSEQLGIRDTDADGIPDVRDAPPDSSFEDVGPLLLVTDSAMLSGRVSARSLPEESPDAPATWSVNRVAAAEYRLDSGPWTPVAADDGRHGDRCEDVTVALAGLSEGWHSVELRGTNDVMIVEPSPATLDVYVNTDCPDDSAEADDDSASAVARPVGTYLGLYHCAFDPDWSRFHLTAGASVTVEVSFDPAQTTMRVSLLDAGLATVATSEDLGRGLARLTATARASGTHYVLVEGEGEREGAYDLVIDADCLDDTREDDDAPEQGTLTTPGTTSQLVLCAGELDHHRVAVQAGESLMADISFEGALGDLDLELLSPAGAVVGTSNGTGDTEMVAEPATMEGVYTVRVLGKSPADRNVYALTLSATGCLDDLGENDDDLAGRRPLLVDVPVRGEICAGDEDWLGFSLSETSLVELDLGYPAAEGNLDLELVRAGDGAVIARSALVGLPEDITLERLIAGDYAVRVFSETGDAANYTLELTMADPVLLMVTKDPLDAILSWNDAGQECYTYRRSTDPSDFSGAVEVLVQDGDEFVSELQYRDRDVINDGVMLYCYLVEPHDCGASALGSSKTASPYPVLHAEPGGGPATIEYTITVVNSGSSDLFGVTVRDDVPVNSSDFTVLEMPVGAVDASLPAPAGLGAGEVVITNVDVPEGGTAVVRFEIVAPRFGAEPGIIVDNQARIEVIGEDPTVPEIYLTDDPATRAFNDDTRVFYSPFSQWLAVTAMWHRPVNIDLRIVDPCGQPISVQDSLSADCQMSTGSVIIEGACDIPSNPDRIESIAWFMWPVPAGIYGVELAYAATADDDPACADRGLEDVTIAVVEPTGGVQERTVTVAPGTGAFERVWEFEIVP